MFERKEIKLTRSYSLNKCKIDRLAPRYSVLAYAGYIWSWRFDGAGVFVIAHCYHNCAPNWFAGYKLYAYNGAPCRSDFVRWLYGLGLAPIDCLIVADSVDFD